MAGQFDISVAIAARSAPPPPGRHRLASKGAWCELPLELDRSLPRVQCGRCGEIVTLPVFGRPDEIVAAMHCACDRQAEAEAAGNVYWGEYLHGT